MLYYTTGLKFDLQASSTPIPPPQGRVRFYIKDDGILYQQNSEGIETFVGETAAGGATVTDNNDGTATAV